MGLTNRSVSVGPEYKSFVKATKSVAPFEIKNHDRFGAFEFIRLIKKKNDGEISKSDLQTPDSA